VKSQKWCFHGGQQKMVFFMENITLYIWKEQIAGPENDNATLK
jgi:hypothetical protein